MVSPRAAGLLLEGGRPRHAAAGWASASGYCMGPAGSRPAATRLTHRL